MLFKSVFLSSLFVSSLAGILFRRPSTLTLDEDKCEDNRPTGCYGCNVRWNESLSGKYVCGDERLGPIDYPKSLPLSTFVAGYDRFGKKSPNDFLQEWYNDTIIWDAKRNKCREEGWRFPPLNGFALDQDGIPMKAYIDLKVGTLVDRFGNSGGRFISPATAPFAQRALHPQSLNTGKDEEFPNDYHVYNVTKPFSVLSGPIMPWFGQPGYGVQFFLGIGTTVQDHLNMKNLVKVHPSDLPTQGIKLCFSKECMTNEEL
ncbi:hypothetical protein FLONG3_1123 [Fusarium longipes]|uniref:TNT domain-containing protein n=1 Tax=Fusarium longipes TaxID=694270 RepID=A0A395T8Z6_9HYPO|nr:hypothetical protein FLONG3_1123 [Fusarium longipes]